MSVSNYVSEHLLDIVLGMYVYTYPKIDDVKLSISMVRPHDFHVYEIINGIDLSRIVIDNMKEPNVCNEGYVYIIEKINIDTYTVCNILKRLFKCKYCSFLGLKDAKAIAKQIIILRKCTKLHKKMYRYRGRKTVKAVFWKCEFSDIIHNGNKFSINISMDKDKIIMLKKRLEYMREHEYRFLNFFGYQRFGLQDPMSHLLGKLVIKRHWDLLIDILCKSRAKYIPNTPEYKVCRSLKSHSDTLRAVKAIPKSYLTMYVNAYQSYLFNIVLSKLWLDLVNEYSVEKALEIIDNKYRYIPIIGSKLYINHNIRLIVDEILAIEDINQNDFSIEVLGLDIKGDMRRALEKAYSIEVYDSGNQSNNVNIEFILNRGCYATVFLRELFRCDPNLYT